MSNSTFKRGDPDRLKIFRGVLVTLLYIATQGDSVNVDDPDIVSRDVLLASLETLRARPSDEDLRNALRYLDRKDYARIEWSNDGSGSFDAVKLLAGGVDLYEGTVNDGGVTFSKRR